ncbi:MAG TPA: ribbon-helix-helix domain-containing protein [Thermoplasmata archaeon]|nr:ribbon-helix-helix domain-containing protein [Thermoplasmata archaeon]
MLVDYLGVPRRAIPHRPSTSIGVRVPPPLLMRIDALVRTGLYRSRAEVILAALRRSMDMLEREAGIQRSAPISRP